MSAISSATLPPSKAEASQADCMQLRSQVSAPQLFVNRAEVRDDVAQRDWSEFPGPASQTRVVIAHAQQIQGLIQRSGLDQVFVPKDHVSLARLPQGLLRL